MKKVSLLLLVVVSMVSGSDAWFLDWFKKKPQQTYGGGGGYSPPAQYNSYGGGYSYYRPQSYKVPVWQALPSGYPARPVQPQQSYDSGYGNGGYGNGNSNAGYGGGATYANGVSGNYIASSNYDTTSGSGYAVGAGQQSYGAGSQVQSYGNSYNDQSNGGFAPVYEVTAPVYGGETGNINVPATSGNADYTGNKPLLSVPVYFPKGTSGTTYSNGVSGFYDATVARSGKVASDDATAGQAH